MQDTTVQPITIIRVQPFVRWFFNVFLAGFIFLILWLPSKEHSFLPAAIFSVPFMMYGLALLNRTITLTPDIIERSSIFYIVKRRLPKKDIEFRNFYMSHKGTNCVRFIPRDGKRPLRLSLDAYRHKDAQKISDWAASIPALPQKVKE